MTLKHDEPLDGQDFKGKGGITRVLKATGYSIAGLKAALRGEAAFRQLACLSLVLIPAAFIAPVSNVERALMIAVVMVALIVELINSAIEAAIDRISYDLHPLSKSAKDMGSAAQLVALVMVALVWAVILL
jgi:diacylglycerol kinase (ATP)